MLGADLGVDAYVGRLQAELARVDPAEVQCLSHLLYEAWEKSHFIFLIGNGGSACTCSHMAEDLGKNCVPAKDVADGGRRLKVLSLTDNVGWITALGNDYAYDQIFVQQLMHYASPGDLLVAVSGSGNSPNVLAAVDWANRHGVLTFGMTGFDGGKLKRQQKAGLHVPLHDMGMIESVHICFVHWVVDDLMARIASIGRYATQA